MFGAMRKEFFFFFFYLLIVHSHNTLLHMPNNPLTRCPLLVASAKRERSELNFLRLSKGKAIWGI